METYLAFAAATLALMLIPGPNVAVIVASSLGHGARFGLLTVAGTSAAMAPQLALTALGMTALLGALGHWFEWVRWAGVAYLLWLGVRTWRAPAVELTSAPDPRLSTRVFWRGLLVSLSNPKTLLFYGAFFPQFVDPAAELGRQLAVLSAIYLAIAVTVDCGWALLAGRVRGLIARRARLANRLTGGLMIGAGIGLAFARRS